MKVLHVYRVYFPDPPGGVLEAVRQTALSIAEHGIDSKIFALSPSPYPEQIQHPEGVVVRTRSWAAPASCDLGGIAAFRRFAELAKWADLIHYHYPWPFADMLHLVVRPKTPAIMTYHSDIVRQRWLGRAYAPLMKSMLKKMTAIVATSPTYTKTSPVLADASTRDRVCVIPLGINERTYSKTTDPAILTRLGLDQGQPFFLFVGVLRYYKGLHTLLEAAAAVSAPIVIAGDGPEMTALNNQARQLGLKNVMFTGRVSDAEKVTLLQHCHAFVLPSHLRSEAYGMVLVEASLFGKPMLTCDIGTGTSFVNLHNETGFVVEPESPRQLAEAMQTLLSETALAAQFGRAARKRYETLFSGAAFGQAYAQLYQDVLTKHVK